jgi:GH15 family glucan-1,4-alpha-glucosidase
VSGPSIGDFALLSDCQSAALVGKDGSVDWYCPERFDAPSIFARLLDAKAGHWSIRPAEGFEVRRAYLEDTMVLRTEFRTPGGRVALTDALALEDGVRGHEIGQRVPHLLLRSVEGLEGEVELELEFAPRPEYGLTAPLVLDAKDGIVAHGGPTDLHLLTQVPLVLDNSSATARFILHSGQTADFALLYRRAFGGAKVLPDLDVGVELHNTIQGWRSWSDLHRGYDGLYAVEVRRSALVL